MELKWLEDFVKLADTGSFSHSADQRSITQSAFSRRIKSLEEWLGVKLIDRGTYPTQLTPAGKAFKETAERILSAAQNARRQLQHAEKEQWVEFATPSTIAARFIPGWLKAIEGEIGTVRVRVFPGNLHDCVQSFLAGRVDFLIVYSHPVTSHGLEPEKFDALRIGRDKMVPICSMKGGSPQFSMTRAADKPIPLLSYGPDSQLERIVKFVIARNGAEDWFESVYENSLVDALKGMATVGRGIAWVPLMSSAQELETGRLALAGGSEWEADLDILLVRSIGEKSTVVEKIWRGATTRAV